MSSFDNTEIAFKGKSDQELRRSYLLFRLIGKPWLVRAGEWLSGMAFLVNSPLKPLIKRTVFRQFCGGETITECSSVVDDLSRYGIGAILDYSIEGEQTEASLDASRDEIIRTIYSAAANRQALPFAVFKPTGIGRSDLLAKMNTEKPVLSRDEADEAQRYFERMDSICRVASEQKVSVFIDAEESWIQDGVDRHVETMMLRYNKEEAVVFTTLQMYRHDRLRYLSRLHTKARQKGFKAGIKLVRGAYMEKERQRAELMGYPSPIQADKAATDRDFNTALEFIIARLDTFSLCCGTHNEESNDLLLQLLDRYPISRNDRRIFSAQLLGMSDHISYNLAYHGFNVVKYVPYGPVKEVLPYLVRRARENTSVAGQSGRELSLIRMEIKRRQMLPALPIR